MNRSPNYIEATVNTTALAISLRLMLTLLTVLAPCHSFVRTRNRKLYRMGVNTVNAVNRKESPKESKAPDDRQLVTDSERLGIVR